MTEIKQGEGRMPAPAEQASKANVPKGSPPREAGSVLDRNSTKVGMGIQETTKNFGEPKWAS